MTDLKTSVFLTEKDIANQVSRMALALNRRFKNKTVTAIGVLKGAFTFYTDLLRKMKFQTVCDFCATSCYGNSHLPSSEVRLLLDISTPIHGRDVLLVEDIVDRGLTLNFLQSLFKNRKPKSLTTVALIHKQEQKGPPVQVDYSCFSLKTSSFLVGYGMDYQERFRQLPHVAQINSFN